MAVTTALVLVLSQDSEPFHIKANSSDFATGAILSQQSMVDRKWRPIAFYSKSLSLVERNYEIHDKEMLAIICTLEEWRHFLKGAANQVQIWTDHKNLEYFMIVRKLNQRQVCWFLYLAHFDFTLCYHPEWSIGKPDALSWRSDHGNGSLDNENIIFLCLELLAICALKELELTRVKLSQTSFGP